MEEFKLRIPVDYVRITQMFGEHPENYSIYGLLGHDGIDFGVLQNSDVYSCTDGKVVEVINGGAYGLHVKVITHCVYQVLYAHLNQSLVHIGDEVRAGDKIGLSGGRPGSPTAGHSSGDHLHIGLYLEGATKHNLTKYPRDLIDPYTYLDFPPPPAKAQYQVIAKAGLNLRNGPGTNYSVLKVLPYNSRISYGGESLDMWTKVITSDGTTGYCYSSFIKLIV